MHLNWISSALLRFVLRRLLHMVPIVIAVIALGFILIQLAPGDFFTQMQMNPDIRPEDIETFRRDFGLDQPWYVQFIRYLYNALRGDFGYSANFKAPVFTLVRQRAFNTILLSVTSLAFAWGFSIPAGVWAARHQNKWQDQVIGLFAFVGLAIPNFFLAFLLLFLVTSTGIPLPIGGMTSIDHATMGLFGRVLDLARHLVIPVFVLGTSGMAELTRVMRANMIEALGQQYIVTARAKGQREGHVVFRHALRNAINPMVTILGFSIARVMSGAALTEAVLGWPGLGLMILTATLTQDLYLVIGSLIYSCILLVIGNLLADILLAVVDPRIRVS